MGGGQEAFQLVIWAGCQPWGIVCIFDTVHNIVSICGKPNWYCITGGFSSNIFNSNPIYSLDQLYMNRHTIYVKAIWKNEKYITLHPFCNEWDCVSAISVQAVDKNAMENIIPVNKPF